MLTKTGNLIARLLFVPVTGVFTFLLFTQFGNSLNSIIYNLTEDYYLIFLRFDTREEVIFWVSAGWIISHICFEIIAYFSKNFGYKKLLTNLRYAPIAVFIIFVFVVPIYDVGMITYSRQQIRNYLYDDSQVITEPQIRLHNDYRHWCGNGVSARENYLYFDTASEGIDNTKPYVRARSLVMTREVQDWLNGGDKRFDNFLANSCLDPDAIVRDTAEELLNKSESRCENYLLKR